ncbi:ArsA family ATPase [Waterburya agarophytonicola K14]|uniref:ArsA family ATPase n=1 Tax=Waterburya agarophytonicola KI4 TaxID=2874699 RepID=A0A964BRA7_9CYAN|nr:ArsA family ATPase [Waterburya agarophytonicola]MCC0176822.1 ArsA family ATPase [Waterburya agarophytonicola KI4]
MPSIVTFLGKGGTGRTTSAIATAKKLATAGKKVLLIGQDSSPAWGMALGMKPSCDPQEMETNLAVVQLNSTVLLEKNWSEVKQLEAQYLRSPILKQVYGQELGIIPGMDVALALNAIREYYQSNKYDAIIYDGSGGIDPLRMFGMPEILSWYFRRFRGIFTESDIVKTLSPFVGPVTSAVLNTTWTANDITSNTDNPATRMLENGTEALSQGNVVAYLVTTPNPTALATAKYLWGSAQQIGLQVGGVLVNQGQSTDDISANFAPLTVSSLPSLDDSNWQALIAGLPAMSGKVDLPKPTEFVMAERKIKVFLPGFDKKEVKLTQYGPEITIEAGDQRRNITLPPGWRGSSVTGAKFQNGYLEVTVG